MQWLIPYAFVDDPGCAQALATLQLPHLEQLLRRLRLTHTDTLSPHTLTPPHERVLAQAMGLPLADGKIPWAALELARSGGEPGTTGWAWVTPAHWQVGGGRIQMTNPAALQLPQDESEALMATLAPWFAQDGIQLQFDTPQRWLAHGEPLVDLACASLDRVIQTDLGPWMPATAGLRRLQNEMQMLLYTHPVNDARSARGMLPVNSFWISASGVLSADRPKQAALPRSVDLLRGPALVGDWAGWAQAWQQIDQGACRDMLAALEGKSSTRPWLRQARREDATNPGHTPAFAHEPPREMTSSFPPPGVKQSGEATFACASIEMVLCSERSALHFTPAAGGWRERLQRRFGRQPTLQDFTDPS